MEYRSGAPGERVAVFVPGLLGTELRTPRGQVVYGSRWPAEFDIDCLQDPSLEPGAVIEHWGYHVARFFSFEPPSPTSDLLNFLRSTFGYRNVLTMPYDWRKGVRHGAETLSQFLVDRILRPLPEAKITIFAHSLGCLVARDFLYHCSGLPRPIALVSFAPPTLGSVSSFRLLDTGDGLFDRSPWRTLLEVATGARREKLREAARGFLSIYELLPRYPFILSPPEFSRAQALDDRFLSVAGGDVNLFHQARATLDSLPSTVANELVIQYGIGFPTLRTVSYIIADVDGFVYDLADQPINSTSGDTRVTEASATHEAAPTALNPVVASHIAVLGEPHLGEALNLQLTSLFMQVWK